MHFVNPFVDINPYYFTFILILCNCIFQWNMQARNECDPWPHRQWEDLVSDNKYQMDLLFQILSILLGMF